jgi:hypothetical protein
LTPGETVIPKQMADKLMNASSPASKQPDVHIHHHATYHVQAFNADGVNQVLEDHGDQFAAHVQDHIRRGNH